MTYEQVIEKIHGFNRFGSKLGLERIEKLMELLGNPQDSMKIIHVAGTNGKGSVSRFLYSVLLSGGYRTGLYTSPFLQRFTERIECGGAEISPSDLTAAAERVFEKVDEMLESDLDSPTEFELVTAIAFCYFSDMNAEFVVLEVGLGGRGDSTNVIRKPVACVVTSISYDHMEYLGDTLEKIAWEKAGIFKAGVPVISNVKDKGPAAVIEKAAREKGCPFYGAPLAAVNNIKMSVAGYAFDMNVFAKTYDAMFISMIGMHQVENAVCALTVIEVLKNGHIIEMTDEKLYEGMKRARQPGRMEVLSENPFVIIDGAHNEAGALALAIALKAHFPKARTLMLTGILADKETDRILAHFCGIADDFIAAEPDNPRKLSAEILCAEIRRRGKNCIAIPDSGEACRYINEKKKDYDLIVAAGSLYLIGAVRGIFTNEKK